APAQQAWPFGRMASGLTKPVPTPFCRRVTLHLIVSLRRIGLTSCSMRRACSPKTSELFCQSVFHVNLSFIVSLRRLSIGKKSDAPPRRRKDTIFLRDILILERPVSHTPL